MSDINVDNLTILHEIVTLAEAGKTSEYLPLLEKLLASDPPTPNANLVKALILSGSSYSFCALEAAERELSLFPNNQAATDCILSLQESHRIRVASTSSVKPNYLVSIVLVSEPQWELMHRAVRAVFHQCYQNVELIIVLRERDYSLGDTLSALDQRIRVLPAPGASFWEAAQHGLQNARGVLQVLMPNTQTSFSDFGVSAAVVEMGTTPQIQFASFERSYFHASGVPWPMRCPFPILSRASFLNPTLFQEPHQCLGFHHTIWRTSLFKQAGNRLDLTLSDAVAYELFARFLRYTSIHTFKLPFATTKALPETTNVALPLRYINEALTVIEHEIRAKPLSDHDQHLPTSVRFTPDDAPPTTPRDTAYRPGRLSEAVSSVIREQGPTISIVTPSFNQGHFLEATIDSILSQGYPRLQYTIIDGGSTDGSVEIIKKYERHLHYWYSEPDKGQYFAIQKGFERTSGDIMTWLNSDDLLQPYCLDHVALIAMKLPYVRWLTGLPASVWSSGNRRITAEPTAISRERYLHQGFDHTWIQQEGTFWRRSLWEQTGGALDLRLSLAADMELWRRFFRYAPLHAVEIPLGIFRVQQTQRSQLLLGNYMREAQSVVNEELALIARGFHTEMIPAASVITLDAVLDVA